MVCTLVLFIHTVVYGVLTQHKNYMYCLSAELARHTLRYELLMSSSLLSWRARMAETRSDHAHGSCGPDLSLVDLTHTHG